MTPLSRSYETLVLDTENAFKRHINTMPGLSERERRERLDKGLAALARIRAILVKRD